MPKEIENEEEETETETETKAPKIKKAERYSLEEVPTQTAIVIRDNKNDLMYSENGILLEILNKLEKIEKAVA